MIYEFIDANFNSRMKLLGGEDDEKRMAFYSEKVNPGKTVLVL